MSKSDSEGVPELLVLVMFFGSGREVTLDQFVCRLPLFLSKGLSGVVSRREDVITDVFLSGFLETPGAFIVSDV